MLVAGTHKEAVLASHFLLRHLHPDELRQLASSTTVVRHSRATMIFQKGDPGSSMMAVIRGRVKVCTYSNEGKEIVLNIIGHGGLFGEIALLDGGPRTADAVTLEETDILVLERSRFLPFLTANPETAVRLIALLCKRLRQTSAHLEDVVLREAPARLARGLLRLAESFGKPKMATIRLDIKLSQQQIGSLVGISRESINKLFGDWSRAGYIDVESGFITIRDCDALRRIGDSEVD